MAHEDNKLLANQVWEEIWHKGDLQRIEELFSPDFVRHDPGRELRGIEQNRGFIAALRSAFPDGRFTVEDQIEAEDKVIVRYRFAGSNLGSFQGMPPTRRQVGYTGILIYRIADGKIAEQWTEIDLLGLIRQLGVAIPAQ
jgi:steroid delta-isomerase-like uncharacterized protein